MDSPMRRGARLPLTLLGLALAAWIATGPSAFARGGGGGGATAVAAEDTAAAVHHGGGGHGGGGHHGGGGYHGGGYYYPNFYGWRLLRGLLRQRIRLWVFVPLLLLQQRIYLSVLRIRLFARRRRRSSTRRLHRGVISASTSRRLSTRLAAACKSSRSTPAHPPSKPGCRLAT